MKAMTESAMYKQEGNQPAHHNITQNYDVLYDIRNSVILFMGWDILSDKIKYINIFFKVPVFLFMYHGSTIVSYEECECSREAAISKLKVFSNQSTSINSTLCFQFPTPRGCAQCISMMLIFKK